MKFPTPSFQPTFQAGATVVLVAASVLMFACGASSGPTDFSQPPLPPLTHKVQLSWDASQSPYVSGYNIYRAQYTTSCGAFARINSVLTLDTAYTDSGVANGSSYCYATTAINTDNAESGFSNVVSNIEIPAN